MSAVLKPADDLRRARGVGDAPWADRAAAVQAARQALAPSLADRPSPSYPVPALGPLAPACEAIATAGQVQPAMAGQALLGAASLLTQGLFNVETLAGRRPLSLYLLTLGDSGDGKSTAQGVALAPVTQWQRRQARAYDDAVKQHDRDKAKGKKGDALPETPQSPYRLASDSTVEGLRRDLDRGVCSQGVFTDEAAAILSGYGMSADHRSKSAAVFSKLWDEGHLSVSRAMGNRVERYGRRVALHWMIQPVAASDTTGDPLLTGLGFWPRFLAAWPAPQQPREARVFRPEALPAVVAYWQRCEELLAEPLPDDAGDSPVIALSDGAHNRLSAAFEHFEREARQGELHGVKPFGLRAAEQACRVAGVLSAFAGEHEVSEATMSGALSLAAYSLNTWRAVVEGVDADQRGIAALRLYEWLTTRHGWCESLATIVNGGPTCVRTKKKRDAALRLLQAAGLVSTSEGRAMALLTPGLGVVR